MKEIEQLVFSGQAILLADGYRGGLAFDTKSVATRSLDEPSSEVVERGPKIGFIERRGQTRRLYVNGRVTLILSSKK